MKFNIKKVKKLIRSRKFFIIFTTCLLVFFIFLFIFSYLVNIPLSKNAKERVFAIKEGERLKEIAGNLRKEGMINSKWVFIFYVWLRGKAGVLQAGNYNLSPSMNIREISRKIINGDIIQDWVKVTIPEGWSIKQIEKQLVASGLISAGDKLPPEQEGFLFPDTYYFDKDFTITDIVEKMLDNFDKKLTEDLKTEIKKQGKTIFEIITMASILEKEVQTYEDMQIVSGIFWKRIENNYPLESCATIAYILGVDKWRYSYEDTRIESPYNTYLNTGLPPTPITNPGLSAIKAAIYPLESDYNFFLSDPETGKTIFSKTLEEHNQNKAKYLDPTPF